MAIIERGTGQQYDAQVIARLGAALTVTRRRPVIEVAASIRSMMTLPRVGV